MKFINKKILPTILMAIVSVSTVGVNISNADTINVSRVYGSNRYQTPVEISKKYFNLSDKAVIASGEGFADALVGGSLVSQEKLPMFLSSKNKISDDVINELRRLNIKTVYILGGRNSVSKAVEDRVKSSGVKVVRLAGKDRFETAFMIAMERFRLQAKQGDSIGDRYVGIDAYNYADALVAGSIVGQMKKENKSYILPYSKGKYIGYDLVFGGYSSIPKDVEASKRIAGKNRYLTSVEAARQFSTLTGKNLDTVVLVNGKNYPDALAASGISGKLNATVITTDPDNISTEALNFIKNNGIKNVIIVGGNKSVSTSVENLIKTSTQGSNSGWKVVDGKKYYFVNGNKLIGWRDIDGNRYYFDSEGIMKTGWIKGDVNVEKQIIENGRYYLNDTGDLATSGIEVDGWRTIDGGIGKIEEDTSKNIVLNYIKEHYKSIYDSIQSKSLILYKDTKSNKIVDVYSVSSPQDYYKIPYEGGYKEGSNKVIKSIEINLFNGNIK